MFTLAEAKGLILFSCEVCGWALYAPRVTNEQNDRQQIWEEHTQSRQFLLDVQLHVRSHR